MRWTDLRIRAADAAEDVVEYWEHHPQDANFPFLQDRNREYYHIEGLDSRVW